MRISQHQAIYYVDKNLNQRPILPGHSTSQFSSTKNKDTYNFFIIQSKAGYHPITLVREGGAAISLTTILI